MTKPRIKLKAATSRRPPCPAAIAEQRAERTLSQKERELATKLAPALNMTIEQFAATPMEEIKRRLDEMKQDRANAALAEFRNNAMDAIRACQTTGQMRIASKAVDQIAQGVPMDRVCDYIFDVAAAESDGHGINNAHSPEGGHRAGIDYQKIYDRQNRKKGGDA